MKHTPLYQLHCDLGAKLVPFAGYEMAVQYPSGIKTEHKHTRQSAGLFDVSHMGQISIQGDRAAELLESLMPMELEQLDLNRQRYCFLTNEDGGILDDLMATKVEDGYFLVVNAACKHEDFAIIRDKLSPDCDVDMLEDRALIALQGPLAVTALAEIAPEIENLAFMMSGEFQLNGISSFVSRSGYTGEDGFEISLPKDSADTFCRTLLSDERVEPIGLGARDSLRLEAGLCLYGHDIDTSTSPVEAGLTWAIQKSRRSGGQKAGGFPGADRILTELTNGVDRCRVGILPEGRAPIREGTLLKTAEGVEIGRITSGGFGPSVEGPIAMGYIAAGYKKPGTKVCAELRGKLVPVSVATLPFHPHGYKR
ncbi:MAG: aminomethyltransferase [Parasphingorhabdus sp.]|jgi:aminomethyltransferase